MSSVRSFRDSAKDTFIQNWPEGLLALSMKTSGFELSEAERAALMTALWSREEEEVPEHVSNGVPPEGVRAVLASLAERIDGLIAEVGGKGFVRLGSRSPKDSWDGQRDGFEIRDGRKALHLLLDSMERIMDDLSIDRAAGEASWLFVRQWTDIPIHAEFRCVLRNRAFAGASQYDRDVGPHSWITDDPGRIASALASFAVTVAEACPLPDAVFDVGFVGGDVASPVLIEINPLGRMTDSCLFAGEWPEDAAAPRLLYMEADGTGSVAAPTPPLRPAMS